MVEIMEAMPGMRRRGLSFGLVRISYFSVPGRFRTHSKSRRRLRCHRRSPFYCASVVRTGKQT